MNPEGVLVIPGPKYLNDCKPLYNLLTTAPEFVDHNGPLTLGGFGALGIPSSFHHPDIRFMRTLIYDTVKPHLNQGTHNNLEMLFDRVSVRRPNTTVGKESWHRDICPNAEEGDIILGGWINLDPTGTPPQHFSCSPGTHTDNEKKTGFVKEKEPSIKKVYEIPPGHIILFHQNILHEIKPQKIKTFSYRLYVGWRLTNHESPLFDNQSIINNQSLPHLPSGQLPPMYAKLHWVNHRHMIEEISKRIKSGYKDPHSGMVFREIHFLLEKFSEYSEKEKSIFFPNPF